MGKEIDWTKAPEGATHLISNTYGTYVAWVMRKDNVNYIWSNGQSKTEGTWLPSNFPNVIPDYSYTSRPEC